MYKVLGGNKNRTFRVLWLLEELGEKYDFVSCSPHSNKALEHNVSGKVPILIDGENAINDSTSILTYLSDKHNKCTQPAGTLKRAHQDSLTMTILDEFESLLWATAKNSFVLPESRRTLGIKVNLKWEFEKNQSIFVKRMEDSLFLTGNNFSITDIIFTHCFDWAKKVEFDIKETKIKDYLSRVYLRPSYKSARKIM